MKKFLFSAFLIFAVGFFSVAQNIPTYEGEGADKAILIDIKSVKGANDSVIIVNLAFNKPFFANVKVYTGNGWIHYGQGMVQNFAEKTKVDSDASIGKYQYAAIVFDTDEKFSFTAKSKNNDLYLYVQPENPSYDALKENAVELDISKIKGKIKDNIRLIGSSDNFGKTGFLIFGDCGKGMEIIGYAYLKAGGDTSFVTMIEGTAPLKNYSAFAIFPSNRKKLSPRVGTTKSDLYVYICD